MTTLEYVLIAVIAVLLVLCVIIFTDHRKIHHDNIMLRHQYERERNKRCSARDDHVRAERKLREIRDVLEGKQPN